MSANDIAGGDRTGRSFQGLVRELRDRLAGFRKARPAAYGRFLGITLVVVAAISFTLAVTNLIYAQAAHSSGKPYKIEISPESQADMKPVVEAFIKTSAGGRVVLSSDGRADVFIAARPSAGYEAIKVTGMPSVTLTAGTLQKTLQPARDYWFSYKRTGIVLKGEDPEVEDLLSYIRSYYGPGGSVDFTAVGDIIPARHVAEAMAKKGTDFPFKTALPLVSGSDVTVGDLECPLTDRVKPPYSGMTFSAPAKTVQGLELLGLDAVTLANNHSTDFGRSAFIDTLKVLKANGIPYAGGGYNFSEAHQPAIVESNGMKFAFLSYNSIDGSLDATSSDAGVTWIRMPPFHTDNPSDVKMVEGDIARAKQVADFVIPFFHWSEEYKYYPNPSMVLLAHAALDAGADMVIGQHPHSVQSIEWYKGKFIAYSLGNFIFDQRRLEMNGVQVGEQARKGLVLRCDFRHKQLVSLELLASRINDSCQTVPLTGTAGQQLYNKVFDVSGWKKQGPSIQ
jgi:poly-gamma-glutamate capsule biosynthesis protein CapA/YwtB (metallophosphatase superfamily)